jgi:hypothetical protein
VHQVSPKLGVNRVAELALIEPVGQLNTVSDARDELAGGERCLPHDVRTARGGQRRRGLHQGRLEFTVVAGKRRGEGVVPELVNCRRTRSVARPTEAIRRVALAVIGGCAEMGREDLPQERVLRQGQDAADMVPVSV